MKCNNFILNYIAFKYLTMACKSCSSITIPFKDCAFFEMFGLAHGASSSTHMSTTFIFIACYSVEDVVMPHSLSGAALFTDFSYKAEGMMVTPP
jgi:hypothetical protein